MLISLRTVFGRTKESEDPVAGLRKKKDKDKDKNKEKDAHKEKDQHEHTPSKPRGLTRLVWFPPWNLG